MQNPDYGAFTQPTSQLATELLTHWQEIKSQAGLDGDLSESFEQRLCSLTSRIVGLAEISGQQVQPVGGNKQRQSALSGQR